MNSVIMLNQNGYPWHKTEISRNSFMKPKHFKNMPHFTLVKCNVPHLCIHSGM